MDHNLLASWEGDGKLGKLADFNGVFRVDRSAFVHCYFSTCLFSKIKKQWSSSQTIVYVIRYDKTKCITILLQAALIMQVLQLSDEQIAMLPQDQRQSILILKEQIARSGHAPT